MDDFVKYNHDARGVVVIIGNEKYDNPLNYKRLPGAMKDAEAMKLTFEHLQFATIFLRNATRDDIFNTISTVAGYGSYPPGYNCFAVVFSGHGGSNNIIVSKDGQEVSIEEAIIRQLDHIADKPKIVFIDACRGGKDIKPKNKEEKLVVPTDMFVAYSTKDGYKAYEVTSGGMWMQILAEELQSSKKSVCAAVADVNQKVKAKYAEWIQPQTYNTTVNIVLSAGLNVVADGNDTDEAVADGNDTDEAVADGNDTNEAVADGDGTVKAASSQQTATLPESVPPHLKHMDQQLDWDHDGVDVDLNEIAHVMGDWEKYSDHLGLTPVDVEDIIYKHKDKPELQRREALRMWKNNQMGGATYKKLRKLFVDSKQSRCVDAVDGVLKKRN